MFTMHHTVLGRGVDGMLRNLKEVLEAPRSSELRASACHAVHGLAASSSTVPGLRRAGLVAPLLALIGTDVKIAGGSHPVRLQALRLSSWSFSTCPE